MASVSIILCSAVLILCCLFNIAAMAHVFYRFYINTKKRKINGLIKSVVTAALIFMFCDMGSHTIFQTLELTTVKLTTLFCDAGIIVISVSYYFGKAGLLCFYVIRAGTSFKNSCLKYSDRQIFIYCLIICINAIISTVGWAILQLPYTYPAQSEQGTYYCIVSAAAEDEYNYFDLNTFFLFYTVISEMFLSIWTVWLFVGRLVRRSLDIYLIAKKTYIQNSRFNELQINDLEQLDYNNKEHIEIWYESTKLMNNTLLLTTKLVVLLAASIFTTWFAFPVYMTVSERWFAIDSGFNVFCMYLSLGFTENIWNKFFCGKQCTAVIFPCVKTCALSHTKQNGNKMQNKMPNKIPSEIELGSTVSTSNSDGKQTENVDIGRIDSIDSNIEREMMKVNSMCGCCESCKKKKWMHTMIKKEYQLYIKQK